MTTNHPPTPYQPVSTPPVTARPPDLTGVGDPRWRERGSCYGHPDPNLWFPEKQVGASNHASVAKAICAGCPVRETCLMDAMVENEQWAVTGGAGGLERRWLRAAWVADGPDGPRWQAAVAVHWAMLDGTHRGPVPNRNGPGAQHGTAAAYARGCRCAPCSLAVSLRGAMSALRPVRVRAGQVAA